MDITRRLIGISAIIGPGPIPLGVDFNGLIRRILLFDDYVLQMLLASWFGPTSAV
jgi:hypothetical protein